MYNASVTLKPRHFLPVPWKLPGLDRKDMLLFVWYIKNINTKRIYV